MANLSFLRMLLVVALFAVVIRVLAILFMVSATATAWDIGDPHITCVGVFADYPTRDGKIINGISSVKSEDSDYTCYLPWGRALHSPFRGACYDGQRCRVVGTYSRKVGTTYFVKDWTDAVDLGEGLE